MFWAMNMFPIKIEPRHTHCQHLPMVPLSPVCAFTKCKLHLCKNVSDYNVKILLNVLNIFQLEEIW